MAEQAGGTQGRATVRTAGKILVIISICLLSMQAFVWLWTGKWLDLTIRYAVEPILTAVHMTDWLYYPENWFGAHKLVVWVMGMPLSLTMFVVGGFMAKGTEATD